MNRHGSIPAFLAVLLLCAAPPRASSAPLGRGLRRSDIRTPAPLPPGSLLIIGFLGAWERWDNPKRSVRKLALRLRELGIDGLYVETAGNHDRKTVLGFLRDALDQNRDRRIDPAEARAAQLILYGQSFGAASAIYLARGLARLGVPVRLTVQVDSVGRRDGVIPSNVARALNLYQRDPGPIRGQPAIRAQDPARTTILANIPFTYVFRDVDMSGYPFLVRRVPFSHWKMDNDPAVWKIVESAILAEIAAWQAQPPIDPPRPRL